MAVFHPPIPPVFTGGAQPYSQKKTAAIIPPPTITDPPFGAPAKLVAAMSAVIAAQPDPFQYNGFGPANGLGPYQPRQLNPSITAVPVNEPPYRLGGPVALITELALIAQPDPWTYNFAGNTAPFVGRKMSPGIPGFSVDQPPFAAPERLGGAMESSVAIEKSMWQTDPWNYPFYGATQPFTQKKLPPSIIAVQVDIPPIDRRRMEANVELASIAQPDPWTYNFIGGLAPFVPRKVTQVSFNNPPPWDRRAPETLASIVNVWQPNPWVYDFGGAQPYSPKQLSPAIPGQSIDKPPPDSRRAQAQQVAIDLNQPPVWNYTFVGGQQPYAPQPVPALLREIPVPIPGAGKRYQKPTDYLPEPAYNVPRAKKIRPIWDRPKGGQIEQHPQPVAKPLPIPPAELFGGQRQTIDFSKLPTFNQFADPDPLGLKARMDEAQDMSDALAVLKTLGLIREE